MNKRDPWVLAGLGLVGLIAIAASFSTLISLALWVGWHGKTAWMFPVCLDVLAIVSGRVWLSEFAEDHARRYARTVSMAALITSVIGNAVGHIVSMHNASVIRVVLAIIVGSIPPIALGAVGHLATLASLQQSEPVAEEIPVVEEIVAESIVLPGPVIKTVFLGMPSVREPESVHVVPPRTETRGRPAVKEPVARKYWESERAAGRTPRPQELADVAGADPKMGRKWHAKFTAEDQTSHTTKTGATLTLVTT